MESSPEMSRDWIALSLLLPASVSAAAAAAEEPAAKEPAAAAPKTPLLAIPRVALPFPALPAGTAAPPIGGDAAAAGEAPAGVRPAPLPGFYRHLAEEAAGYAVWGSRRLNFDDEGELEHRAEEISRAAERIFSRSMDDYVGRRVEDLLERSDTAARVRRVLDTYTAVTFRGLDASLGEPGSGARAGGREAPAPAARRPTRTTARLQVDLHPKVILKSDLGTARARLEVPLSGSEYRFTLSRPLSSRVSSEIFAAYPQRSDGHARAGLHLFITF